MTGGKSVQYFTFCSGLGNEAHFSQSRRRLNVENRPSADRQKRLAVVRRNFFCKLQITLRRGAGFALLNRMTLDDLCGKIKACAEQMNSCYGSTVFDEWVVVSLEHNRARILHYSGPRNDEFLKNFVNDLGSLRTALLDAKYGPGDFEFSRHGVGTGIEAFLVLGEGLYLMCNNTRESMDSITKNPRWLSAQVPFANLAEEVRGNSHGISWDTKFVLKS